MASISFILLTIGSAFVSAIPTPSPNSTATMANDVMCGTTGSATLSACQSILDSWSGQVAITEVCSGAAYKIASAPGCSIYANSNSQDPTVLKKAIESIMTCTNDQHGTVNGMAKFDDGTRVCLGSDEVCGSCVEHLANNTLVENPRSLEARAVTADQFKVAVDKLMYDIGHDRPGWRWASWDEDDRIYFTKAIVSGLVQKFPLMNAVVCHTKHTTKFDGQKGVDWFHRNIQLDKAWWGTVGYELYLFKSGTFERHGDGGFNNWAWNGVVHKKGMNGAYLEFKSRS